MLMVALAISLAVPATTAADDECDEPCGYIVPIIDLDFPDKQLCGGSGLVFTGDSEGADCTAVPAMAESMVIDGTLTWYYDASEEPPYPKAVGEDIVLSFSGTRNNPGWLDMAVSPSEMFITDADLVNPDYFHIEENSQGGQVIWFRYEQPISVTFTRTGDPTAAEAERIAGNDAMLQVFLKAKSTESSSTYRESFGVEEFRFVSDAQSAAEGSPDPSANEAPGPALPLILAALGAVLVARRRWGNRSN